MSTVQVFDKYRERGAYHWRYIKKPSKYKLRVDAICDLVRPGDRCLDLGCGDGAYVYCVSQKCRHVVGVDADQDGIRCAREQLTLHGVDNFTLVHASFTELDGRLPRWLRRHELVYSMDVIEHLYNPETLLDAMERHLAPGGTIVVGTPLFIRPEEVSPHHVKEYTVEELHRMLAPRFAKVDERFLPASLPVSEEVLPRFYLYIGRCRRRWFFGR